MAQPSDGIRAAELRVVTVLWILAMPLRIDLVMDPGRRATLFHAFVEGSAIIAAAVGVVLGARRLRTALHEAQDLLIEQPPEGLQPGVRLQATAEAVINHGD